MLSLTTRIQTLLKEKRETARAFRKVVATCNESNRINRKLLKKLANKQRYIDYLEGYSQAMSETHECPDEESGYIVHAEPLKPEEITEYLKLLQDQPECTNLTNS